MTVNHYDFIIIGTGAGGGTLAYKLATSGQKILVLEQGNFLPKEKANLDTKEVSQKERYRTSEIWYDKHDKAIKPLTHYYVVDTPRSKDAGILNRIIVKTTARIISAFQVLP